MYRLENHVSKLQMAFCNSLAQEIQDTAWTRFGENHAVS